MKKLLTIFLVIILSKAGILKSLAQPPNDAPCAAIYLTFGVITPGYTNGATYVSEPPVTSCFDAPPYNTVWYYFTAPASGCATVKTTTGTNADTQIGVYKGSCGSLIAVSATSCNDNVSGCSGYNYRFSLLQLSGLTPGSSYYVMVDGRTIITGSFSIMVEDACTGSNLPPIPGRDCIDPFPVCKYTIDVANPGFQDYGNICDFNSTIGCLLQGEKESAWYIININGAGNLEFDIIPNDWTSGCTGGTESDYDFAIWKVTGGVASTCGNLGTPLRCNYNTLGLTGCYQTGIASPGAYGGACWDAAYEPGIPVVNGEKYLLVVSNWDNTNYGFTLSIQPSSPILATVPPGGVVVWTGSTNTSWFNVNNWGGCQIPDCSHGAVIPGFTTNQPVIDLAGGSVRDIYINAGGSLTLNSGIQFMICGDFNNVATFNALANSTVVFEDTAVTPPLTKFHHQTIAANNIAPNDFWNVTVKKPPGYNVIAAANIDMAGNFLVTGGSFGGAFVATFRDHKIGGNFTVDVTAPNIASYKEGSSLQFTGSVQTYLNRGNLTNVIMNQTGAGTLTLQNHSAPNAWMTVSDSGSLTLNYGKIITGANRVEVKNRAIDAISPGNTNSYIQGNSGVLNSCLQKYLDKTGLIGTYEFPIGTVGKGYQRLSLELTVPLPSGVDYIYATFNDNTPANNTALGSECTITYHTGPATPLNNGFWQLQPVPSAQFNSGEFTPNLYNRSYSNALSGWTVMFNKVNPAVAADWYIDPPVNTVGCSNLWCPVTQVKRPFANSVATMLNAPVLYIGTAQSVLPLPVELMLFEATPKKDLISLKWITASEENNLGFDLERAVAPSQHFEKIGFVSGNGSTSELNDYSFDDFDVTYGNKYYYRLKQVDFNGNSNFSQVVSASLSKENFSFYVFNDPSSKTTNLVYYLKESSDVRFEIFNIMGQKVEAILKSSQEKGSHILDIAPAESINADGIYMIRMIVNDEVQTRRTVILK
ncbi:MAG TPA: T9SS type A sorting domain-containing protein [Bacteroidia bacterium]|nr:T9SS type A sorting domain-containing protein [Bacteroidia bacterium]